MYGHFCPNSGYVQDTIPEAFTLRTPSCSISKKAAKQPFDRVPRNRTYAVVQEAATCWGLVLYSQLTIETVTRKLESRGGQSSFQSLPAFNN